MPIIGIKGTTFIVDSGDNASVKLKEGVVGIQSIKEEFELYRKAVQAEYNKYLSEQEAEYQKYLNEQNKGTALLTKEFDLQAGNTISFDGQKVDEKAWTKEDDAEFERFEALMKTISKPLIKKEIIMKEKLLYLSVLVPILIVTFLLHLYKVEPFESFSLRYNDINFELQKKHRVKMLFL